MSDVAGVRQRVQAYLTAGGSVGIDADGDFCIDSGSTCAFVQVLAHPNGEATYVKVMAPVLIGAPATARLFEFVATNDPYIFGRLVAVRRDAHTVDLYFTHRLLGDYLDREELLYAVAAVASSADAMDEDLQLAFGGQLWSQG